MRHFLREVKARLLKGDALNLYDVARGFVERQAAETTGGVDVALFSVSCPTVSSRSLADCAVGSALKF